MGRKPKAAIKSILDLWAKGLQQKQIAARLKITESNVEYALSVGRGKKDPRAARRRPPRKLNYGRPNCNAKLAAQDIRRIRLLHKQKVPLRVLAEQFRVSLGTIHPIITGKTWKYVE